MIDLMNNKNIWFEYAITPPNYPEIEPLDVMQRTNTLPDAKRIAASLGAGSAIYRIRNAQKDNCILRRIDMMWDVVEI